MKQIDEALSRALDGQKPLKKKWRAKVERGIEGTERTERDFLILYHYHYLILVHDLTNNHTLTEWWEKPTDKRGLLAAKEWIREWHTKNGTIPRVETANTCQ